MTVAAALVLSGCTLGPSQRPPLATAGPGGLPPVSTDASTSVSAPPSGPGGAPRTADPVRWTGCDTLPRSATADGVRFAVDCATVRPDGSGLLGDPIAVARARADGVPDDAPTLVVVSGGQGENPADAVVAVAAGLSPAVRRAFAVVTIDLVGTGPRGVRCLGSTAGQALLTMGGDPTSPAAAALLTEQSRELTFQCGDEIGPDLTAVNTTTAADQLDAVRSALGGGGLRLLGRGWGATLGAVYADRYPGTVAAMVLEGPADPRAGAVDRLTAVAATAENTFDAFAAACRARPDGCPLGDDPRARVSALVADLDTVAAPGSGRATGGSVLLDLLLSLGQPDDWSALADRVAAAGASGVTASDPLLGDLASRVGLVGDDSSSAPTSGWTSSALVYGCNDTAIRMDAEQLTAAATTARAGAPLFGAFTVGLLGWCGNWPAPDAALGAVRATGAPPLLVLSSTGDPWAPADGVRALAGQLSSARVVTWQSPRSGSYPASSCVTDAVDAYLVAGTTPSADVLCPP